MPRDSESDPTAMVDLVGRIKQAQDKGLVQLALGLEADISELPEEIGNLTNLEELEINGDSLERLPAGLWRLTNLRHLVIGSRALTELPTDIGSLIHLRSLWLGGCALTELPDSLIELRELEDLRVGVNRLSEFPSPVLELPSLRCLMLHQNQIKHLPQGIGRLTKLQELVLDSNLLSRLPPELTRLSELRQLTLVDNPFEEPLPELIAQGIKAVFSYLKGLEEDGISLYEAKVLLTGEGEVGKTSLVKALKHLPFKEGLPTTHGIELANIVMKHPYLSADLSLNLWDFGGQEVYRITHQFFFSRRALYILVWKPRQGQQENAVEYWLRLIRLRVGSDVKVMIIATHSDERRPELDVPHLQQNVRAHGG